MGRPGEKRNYRKEYDTYHSKPKQKKKRADRNSDRKELEKKRGKKLPPKVKGKATSKDKETGHSPDYRSGGSKSSPVKTQIAKKNRGWRKGIKGDKGRTATRKRNK